MNGYIPTRRQPLNQKDNMQFFPQYITAELKQALEKAYPQIINNIAARNFCMHALMAPLSMDYGAIRDLFVAISHKDIARLTGQNIDDRNWVSQDYVDEMLLLFPGTKITNYLKLHSCRKIDYFPCPVEVKNALIAYRSQLHKEKIHYATGNKMTKALNATCKKEAIKIANDLTSAVDTTPNQQFILDYLNNLNERIFSEKVKQNYVSANNAIYAELAADTKLRNKYVRLLGDIRQNPKPLYHASSGSHRLFSRGSIPHLIRPARKALCAGWMDFDLESAYVAILQRKLGLAECIPALTKGVWEYLAQFNVQKTENIKEAIYSLCFGRSIEKLLREFPHDENILRLTKLTFIKELAAACSDYISSLRVKYNLTHKQARGLFTKEVSAIELDLMAQIFKCASGYDSFQIVLYQYDGGCIAAREQDRAWIMNTINKHMNSIFSERGYITKLKWATL